MCDYRRGLSRGLLLGQLAMLVCFAIGIWASERLSDQPERPERPEHRTVRHAEIWAANRSAALCTLTIKAYGPDTLYVRTLPAGGWVPIHE